MEVELKRLHELCMEMKRAMDSNRRVTEELFNDVILITKQCSLEVKEYITKVDNRVSQREHQLNEKVKEMKEDIDKLGARVSVFKQKKTNDMEQISHGVTKIKTELMQETNSIKAEQMTCSI